MAADVTYLHVIDDDPRRGPVDLTMSAVGEVLYDDPRYLVVHTEIETIHIPHGRVIAIVEPKETE